VNSPRVPVSREPPSPTTSTPWRLLACSLDAVTQPTRRVHLVELSEWGEEAFHRDEAAAGFDQQLRAGLDADEIAQLSLLLTRLRDNVNTHNKQREEPDNDGSGVKT